MADPIEHELCANCKKEIPQPNYVMHTAHCARNITLCPGCKEPMPKNQFADHQKRCRPSRSSFSREAETSVVRKQASDERTFRGTSTETKQVKIKETRIDKAAVFGTGLNGSSSSSTSSSGASAAKKLNNGSKIEAPESSMKQDGLLACKYCDLELPKLELDEHENYCGSRTDKCNECGELVMYKYKKLHEDSNHGFIKLNDEPGPRATWDSNTQRTSAASSEPYRRRSRLPPLEPFNMTPLYNMMDYIPPSTSGYSPSGGQPKKEKGDSYKEMSRRLDCKTEYIRNLLHDSASITAPLRSSGVAPRNHFNHNKGSESDGPAPQPPFNRRRNPPTELTIPCEFCGTPVPHEDLIEHETGCRPDLARYNPRASRANDEDDYFYDARDGGPAVGAAAAAPSSPEVDLPCEFCANMFPASQLLRHQATCY